jgi:hypothetical protein
MKQRSNHESRTAAHATGIGRTGPVYRPAGQIVVSDCGPGFLDDLFCHFRTATSQRWSRLAGKSFQIVERLLK